MKILKVIFGTIRDLAQMAHINEALRKENRALQGDLAKMQRYRDYWVAYQQQTASEAGRAQEIMVKEIDRLRHKLGEPEDSSWIDSVKTWEKRRINSEGSHPFKATFNDIAGDLRKESPVDVELKVTTPDK